MENPEKLKELLEADKALSNMIYDMIKKLPWKLQKITYFN
jgi:hypothetical protein